MSFGGGGSPQPQPVVAPEAPPNPPMFGANAPKKAGGQQTPSFNASILGALPTSTANKSLLGQ